ncbi:MAG: hypothetical protein HY706_00765 [Candidatus Hydrogenedentes bacterium]|nr:hypothetical protein [Candidatus Hydrogenedentota bacterium]
MQSFASCFTVVILLVCAGCTVGPHIATATDLVAHLKEGGIQVDSQEPAPVPTGDYFRFDEGVTVKGPDLWVDILRIEDKKVFNLAKDAKGILILAASAAGRQLPDSPEVYTRYPFVVVTRQEPTDSQLQPLLRELLPPLNE